MNKFKIGDRVKVYGCIYSGSNLAGQKMVVESFDDHGWIKVRLQVSKTTFSVHYKQCRKLKKKEKPEFLGYMRVRNESFASGRRSTGFLYTDQTNIESDNDYTKYKIFGVKVK